MGLCYSKSSDLPGAMTWGDVDEQFLSISQKSANSIEDAEAIRVSDDEEEDGNKSEVGSVAVISSSQSSSSDIDQDIPWWAKLLKEHTCSLEGRSQGQLANWHCFLHRDACGRLRPAGRAMPVA